jgi:ubiquinone/menaquinone biosynthesis C-methylase UbiE
MSFKKKTERDTMAFGKYLSYRKYDLHVERYHSASEFIRKNYKKDDAVKILDVGSGDGALKYFLDDYPNIEWQGVDFQERRIRQCENLGYKMIQLDIDKNPLPFPENNFDVVNASHVIEHLEHMTKALQELERVTKPGGLIIIGVPTKLFPFSFLRGWLYKHELKTGKRKRGQHCQAFDVVSWFYLQK